jgi:hypothetical protein
VPNKLTGSHLMNCFHEAESMQEKKKRSGQPSKLNDNNLDDIHQASCSGHF